MRATTSRTGRSEARNGRGCGYGRRPARVSRWKRTPRVRGGGRVFLASTTQHVSRRARPPRLLGRLVQTGLAGLGLAAGMASWALALTLLVF